MMYPINCWYAALDAAEVRPGKPAAARRFGLDLVLWRDDDGVVRCVVDRCPHRGAALSAGRVRDGHIECPFHGFRFDGEGHCVRVPCNGPDGQRPKHLATRSLPVTEAHGLVWLWWGDPRPEYPPVPWFEELDDAYEYAGFAVDSPVNWMRNVENQLDWAHLPFVHGNTIGRGFPHRLEIRSEVVGDRLLTWPVHDEDERGEARTPLKFAFPNLWTLAFGGPNARGFMVFAPVDDTHCRLYLRTYARRLLVPGLSGLLVRLSNVFNRRILAQDARVVATQPPGPTTDVRDERLVQADLPIAQFRKEVARRSRPAPESVAESVTDSVADPDLVPLRRPG